MQVKFDHPKLVSQSDFVICSVTLCTDSIVMSLTPSEVLMELEKLDIFCDEEKVFRFQVIQLLKP